MNKKEYIEKLDKLNLDKSKYCIIAGGVMLLYGLKETTEDIDIKIKPDYYEEIKKIYNLKKSPKANEYPYLYELDETTEVSVLDYDEKDVRYVDGYPVESLELVLKWMIEHNRQKDQEKIKIIQNYLNKTKNMQYLVESHLGGYYVSDLDPKTARKYSEYDDECDNVVFSFEKGHFKEAIKEYFSRQKYTRESIESSYSNGIKKEDLCNDVMFEIKEDQYLISCLYEQKLINVKEMNKLLNLSLKNHRNKILLIKEVYSIDYMYTLKS